MLRLDLHTHSRYSPDSSLDVKEMLTTAVARGIHGISITDHNTLEGSVRALELGRDTSLIVVRGMEVSSRDGHILGYGLEEDVPSGLTAGETVDRIVDQGGFAVAAHPYRFWSGLGEDVIRGTSFQALEVLNSMSVTSHNQRVERLAQELGLPATGGSDAHRLSDLGRALVLVPEGLESEEEVLLALQKGLGRTAGTSRGSARTARYVAKSVGEWVVRGFKRI